MPNLRVDPRGPGRRSQKLQHHRRLPRALCSSAADREARGTCSEFRAESPGPLPSGKAFHLPRLGRFGCRKIKLSRAAVTSFGLVGPGCRVAFPLQNYCRSLAPTCYSEANLQRELYPSAEDMRRCASEALPGYWAGPISWWTRLMTAS